jgi:phosphoribosylanthranilate isomerase
MPRPRVKICCISSLEEAELAVARGADALGLVSEMPSGPGVIPEQLIARIVTSVPPLVSTFLLTCRRDPNSIIEQQRRTGASTLQLVDRVEPSAYGALRAALPGVRLVQVIHVTGPETIDEAVRLAPEVDALLLDTGNPNGAVRELGGTGRVHDWSMSAQIRERASKPVFLAGGLTPENAADAFARVRPFALDVCNGVRTVGHLDRHKLHQFFAVVRSLG